MWRLFAPLFEHMLRAALDLPEFVSLVSEQQYGCLKEVADRLDTLCRESGW